MTAGLLSVLGPGVSADSPGSGPVRAAQAFGPYQLDDDRFGMVLSLMVTGGDTLAYRASTVPWTEDTLTVALVDMLAELCHRAGWDGDDVIDLDTGFLR